MDRIAVVACLETGSVLLTGALLATTLLSRPTIPRAGPPPDVSPRSPAPRVPVLRKYPGACTDSYDFRFPTHVGADGVPDEVVHRTFDAAGRTLTEDSGRADAPNRIAEYHYDRAGRLDREVFRVIGGKTAWVRTYRYDADGRRLQAALDEDDPPESTLDGRPDWLELRTYDRGGRLATMRENVRAGTRRRGLGHWYRHDDRDRLVLEKVDNDGDGEPNFEIRYTYDPRERLVEKRTHWYGRGPEVPLDEAFTYAYDADGRLASETRHDGFSWMYTYDAAGNLIAASCIRSRCSRRGW